MEVDNIIQKFNDHLDKNINFQRVNHFYLIETNYTNKIELGYELINKIIKEKYINLSFEELLNEEYVLIVDTENSIIKTEEVLEIKNKFSRKAVGEKPYFYLINDCEKMNRSSANKLLKFLEEPIENIYAIMLTSNKNKLLRTIVSRCQLTRFYVIENEFINQKNEDIDFILKFVSSYEEKKEEAICYLNKDFYDKLSDRIYLNKFLNNILFVYNDVLNLMFVDEVKYFNKYKSELEKIKKNNNIKTIHDKVYILSELINLLVYNPNIKLLIDKLIIRMSGVDTNE